MVAIFVFSSMPAPRVESTAEQVRGVTPSSLAGRILTSQATSHLVEFGVLAILLYRIPLIRRTHLRPLAWSVPLGIAVAYGASDELHQAFVPGRVASLTDLGFDVLGAVAGTAVAEATVLFHRRRSAGTR